MDSIVIDFKDLSMMKPEDVLWNNTPLGSTELRFIGMQNGQAEEIAHLSFEGGELHFEGNMDEAAKMFFEEWIKPLADDYIRRALDG